MEKTSDELREYTEPLSEFQEGQWWVNELDALVKKEGTTDDQKRAVAVVHHMLRSAALASAPVAVEDHVADECAADTPIKAAYVEHFGHVAGWLSYKGSWFIEGFKAGQKSAPVAAQPQTFEAWWASEVTANGGNDIGADYRHWAHKGWRASAPVAGKAQAEKFIQATIDQAPEPLRRLGEYLSRVLDEDQWTTAERMLLSACYAAPQASEAQTSSPVDESILKDQEDAKRWRWLWNRAENVSFSYQLNQYTKTAVMGLSCGSLKDAVDFAMKNN